MNTYEREAIGNIVIIKNLVFKDNENDSNKVDHAWFNGRPCLIIYSDNEYDYFLTFKSFHDRKYDDFHFEIGNYDLIPTYYSRQDPRFRKLTRKKGLKGAVNLQNIYKLPISGHDEVGKITFNTYKKVINKLKKCNNNISLEEVMKKAKAK